MRCVGGLLALWVAACAPSEQATCDYTATRTIAFTTGNAEDVVTARSIGATCAQTTGLFTITNSTGDPVWAWTSPLPRAFGAALDDAGDEEMHAFLERWTAAQVMTTARAPDWPLLAPGQTTLDRLTYDDIRARDLPMLCHASGTARETCVFWEPAAGGAGHLLDRDVDIGEPPE